LKRLIGILVNGERHEIVVEPQTTMLEVLREQLALTGTKEGCGTGECGSCTVLIDGKPILSCLALAVDIEKQNILTIEGYRDLTPMQQAFLDRGAVQCGFCTPGMVLSATALIEENPHPTEAEIQKALEGNLCRCTGYNKIVEAVQRAAEQMSPK
jgi:carbon-monoxide dehydrogenase small subunit